MANPVKEVMAAEKVGGIYVVTILLHELDSAHAEDLSSQLLALLNEGKTTKFLLDFGAVRYMESACFGALVTFVKWLSRFDGKIALCDVSENVRFLFAVTGLDKVFPLHRDVPSALEAMQK